MIGFSVASFDKFDLEGYQLKGKVSMLDDEKERRKISLRIIDKLTRLKQGNNF